MLEERRNGHGQMKVIIIGCGTMGHVHASCLANIAEAELVGIVDASPERAEELGRRYGVPASSRLEDFLDRADVGYVCTPTPTHRTYTEKLAEAGAHIFCEKPIAPSIEDGLAMMEAAKAAGVRLFIGHVLRFFHEYAAIKRLLDEGRVGRPAVARASRCSAYPRGADDWFCDYRQSGGALLDMSIHDMDFCNWCLGRPTRVFCKRHKQHLRDYALAIVRYESGAMAHIEGSWAHPGGFRTAFELAGSEGLLWFDSEDAAPLRLAARAAEGNAPGVAVPESPVATSPYELESRHFLDRLRTGEEFLVTPDDDLAALRVALAAARSAETGEAVTL